MNGIFFEGSVEDNFIGHIMKEVYVEKVYTPFLVGKKDLTILDIGANLGITSHYFSQFASKVFALEPSLEHFNCLFEMVKFNGLQDKIIPVKKALYIKNGKFSFGGPTINKTMRSLHMATWEQGKPSEEVEAITLKKLFEDYKIEKVDFMKIDTEGSETEILSGSDFKSVASKIDTIVGEYHEWSGRNQNQIKDALELRGYEVSWLPNQAHLFVARRK